MTSISYQLLCVTYMTAHSISWNPFHQNVLASRGAGHTRKSVTSTHQYCGDKPVLKLISVLCPSINHLFAFDPTINFDLCPLQRTQCSPLTSTMWWIVCCGLRTAPRCSTSTSTSTSHCASNQVRAGSCLEYPQIHTWAV